MVRTRAFTRSSGSGAWAWLFQRISGLVLAVLVTLHYFLMHSNPDRGHTFKSVYQALTDPVWGPWFKTLDLTMLALGLWHGLNGTWNVVRDFDLRAGWNYALLGLLVMAGLAVGVLGFTTILAF